MSHRILDELQSQHQKLSLFLYSFRQQIQRFSDPHSNTNIFLILEMLDAINLFPEQFHHPVEDHIFTLLLKKNIGESDLIKGILNEHGALEARTGKIREEFTALASTTVSPADSLVEDTLEYIDDQMEHLFHEEEEIFPLVEEYFDDNDWLLIEQAIEPFDINSEIDAYKTSAMNIIERFGQIDAGVENPDMDPYTDAQTDG